MRRPSRVVSGVAAAAAVLVAVGTIALWRHHERAEEWAHGGDDAEVSAQVRTMPPARLGATLAALGEEPEPGIGNAAQMAVVRVSWAGTSEEGGHYVFVLLDDRVRPAAPLRGYGANGPGGGQGPGWNGAYRVLAEHYPWLARTASRHTGVGWSDQAEAFEFAAREDGRAVLTFWLGHREIPTSTPEKDLALAVAYVRDGEVRWAKRVPLEPL